MARKPCTSFSELVESVKQTYPKRLANKEIKLKYEDDEGEWLNISDDDDTAAFNEYANNKQGKKARIAIEIVKSDKAETAEEKKVRFEELKDFKLTEAMENIEKLFNSEEKFGPGKLIQAFMQASEGTKAEVHMRRFVKMFKHRLGKFRSPSERRERKEKKCSRSKSNTSSSESPVDVPFFAKFGFGPGLGHRMHGPRGHPHMRGHHGFGPQGYGFDPREFGRHGEDHHNKRAMKIFKKFMKAFEFPKSSSSSEEEVQQTKKPVISNLPTETKTE